MRKLWNWLLELDQILRGEVTRVADLKDGSIKISVGGISLVLILLGMIYGLCMAVFALVTSDNRMQLVGSAVKVPALFLLTLVVTLPSLYVFTALVNARLSVVSLIRLFVAAIAVNIAVLSSLGPIVAFFSLITDSYNFMVLLNVVVFAVSGALGLTFLLQTLHRLNIAPRFDRAAWERQMAARRKAVWEKLAQKPTPAAPAASSGESEIITPEVVDHIVESTLEHDDLGSSSGPTEPPPLAPPAEPSGPLDPVEGHVLGSHTRLVFNCWVILFGLVGAQMGWVLRPFIGAPNLPFEWFRPRGSNFFEAVFHALQSLLTK